MKKLLTIGAIMLVSQVSFGATTIESKTTTQDRNVNITIDPLSMILGIFDAGADFRVNSNLTLGGYFKFASYEFTNSSLTGSSRLTAYGGGAKMHYYLTNNALEDSWYVSPSIGFMPVQTFGSTQSVFSTGTTIGYQWVYNSGFNMNLGFGVQYISISSDMTDSYLRGIIPAAEFRMGFAF